MNFDKIEPLPAVCRQSSIKCALACKRYWFCKHRMGIRLRGAEYKEAAELGTIYHRLQQLGPGHEQEVRNEIQKQQVGIMMAVDKGEDLDGSMLRLANNLTNLYRKAEVMAHIFWEKYPQPPQFKVIDTEINHSIELDDLIIEGTIDKLLLDENTGYVWIRDHKSTGRPLAVLFGGLAWSIQARIYRLLAVDYCSRNGITDIPSTSVRGFILDGIITPGIKLCKTDEKNAKDWNVSVEDAYLRRVKQWYAEYEVKADLAGKQNTKALDSKGILFAESLIPSELQGVLDRMGILQSLPMMPEAYSRDVTRTACFAYEKQCIYHDLCETDPKQWDRLFETKYELTERAGDEENVEEDSM